MTPVAKWLGHYDTGIIDVLDRPASPRRPRLFLSSLLRKLSGRRVFDLTPFIVRAQFPETAAGKRGAEPDTVGSPGRMETKDDNQPTGRRLGRVN